MKKLLYCGMIVLSACAAPAPKENDAEKIVRNVFEAFNDHDWERMESYYADSVELQDPAYPGGKTGKQGMTDFYRSVPDIHDEVKTVFASGNQAVVEFVSTGTIGGSRFELPICTVFTIENGKVVRDHTYYNQQNP